MRVLKRFITLFLGIFIGLGASAQTSKNWPFEKDAFIEEVVSYYSKKGDKEQDEFIEQFGQKWADGTFSSDEQEKLINQVNVMLLKNYSKDTEVLSYLKLFDHLKSGEAVGKIDPSQFFKVTDDCLRELDRKLNGRYFNFLNVFVSEGKVFKTSNASWEFEQQNPKLGFTQAVDSVTGKTFKFPYFEFENTALNYFSKSDSTKISGTGGQLNLMNRVYKAQGGRIDWEKMGLDPNDVYCELGDYILNLNYSFVRIDTVTFYYNSLIGRPLKGRYEDINKGFRDTNKANYPYFRSYEGGVVIENLIPNVRYEGGFSLRGVRKIGSGYTEWKEVEQPEEQTPPEEEPTPSEEEEGEEGYYDEYGYYTGEDEYGYEETDYYTPFEESEYEEPDYEAEAQDELGGSYFDAWENDPYFGKEQVYIKAKLSILQGQRVVMDLLANEFVLDMEKLISKSTAVKLYITEKDTISHPSLDVEYYVDSNEVYLNKNPRNKFSYQPFSSTYHHYNIYFDQIRWKPSTNKIYFTFPIDKENETGAMESEDFFKYGRWKQYKGILRFHPLGGIYRYYYLNPGVDIYPEDVVKYLKAENQLDAFLLALPDLEGGGFITYDKTTRKITPLPRLFKWAKAARGKSDYDAIQIVSNVKSGDNAVLNLDSLTINTYGVSFFRLSDTNFVAVIPQDSQVTIGKDRAMNFAGKVAAGELNFYGEGEKMFRFDYENFKIYCDSLDSMKFILVREILPGQEFTPLQKALRKTSIEGVTGAIYINKPNNKSGLEPEPGYPVFDSYTNSYIYWAKDDIRDGDYTKDKLYFSIDPFVLDSLDNFDESKLKFEGEFFSSEIFPSFRQELVVMEDFTLGFRQITPDTGYACYEGKGRFYNTIQLDGGGLSGKGKMEFLGTTAESDSFQFYFDTVKAVTKDFIMPHGEKNGVYYPEIKARQVSYKWLTKEDIIELESTEGEPIVLFEGEGTFDGKLVITPEGLKGSGTLTMNNVVVSSEDFVFKENDFVARKGTFALTDPNDPSKKLFVANETEVNYDVTRHHADFATTNLATSNIEFPGQSYVSSLGKGVYDRAQNDIVLEANSAKQKDNFFYSTSKEQDSLNFLAGKAYYNLATQEIEVDEVPFIDVADARVTPRKKHVTIKEDGFVGRLDSAAIEANLETKYHKIYQASVEINSRYSYTGSGKYDYITINGKDQYIEMAEISVRRDTVTVSTGNIEEEQKFYLTDRIFFKGKTFLEANKKYMRFKGEVQIESDNEFFQGNWLAFDTIVNPDSIFIPIRDMKNLFVGTHFIPERGVFYSTFLQPKKDRKDVDLLLAGGGLTFDRINQEFKIGPREKLSGQVYRGATASLNDQAGIITTEGGFEFPFKFQKNTIEVKLAGKWKENTSSKEITTDLIVGVDYGVAVPKDAWEKLAERFQIVSAVNADVSIEALAFQQSIAEFLDEGKSDEKNTQNFIEAVNAGNPPAEIKIAKDLPYSLLLSDVKFTYDEENKAFFAAGDIGVIGIGGKTINKMTNTNTKIEYDIGKISPSGVRLDDALRVYIEFDEFSWVYLSFEGDVVRTISSDYDGYNAVLTDAIAKRKKNDGFRFELADETEKDEFKADFVKKYIWRE